MSHIRYTISRSGTYYYNRRVPSHAVAAYGTHIRQALSSFPTQAESYATRLSNVLEASWAANKTTTPINIPAVVDSFKPKSYLLSEMAEEYLSVRKIDLVPPEVALDVFMEWQEIVILHHIIETTPSCLSISYKSREIRLQRSDVGSILFRQS